MSYLRVSRRPAQPVITFDAWGPTRPLQQLTQQPNTGLPDGRSRAILPMHAWYSPYMLGTPCTPTLFCRARLRRYRGISGRSLREYEPFQLQSGTITASLKSVQEQLSLAQRHHTIDFTTIGSRINVLAVCREQDARLGRPLECIDSGHRREGGAEVTLGRLHTFCSVRWVRHVD